MKLLICILIEVFCSSQISAQYKIRDSCADFTLNIQAKNLISDSIMLSYIDCDKTSDGDTLILSDGKARVTGRINRATEGILYTNIRSRWMDGPRVIRFIIEPGKITLHFTILNDTVQNVVIEGSHSQKQKEGWEADNSTILNRSNKYLNEYMQLLRQNGSEDSMVLIKKKNDIRTKMDTLRASLVASGLEYVKENPDSYFSGYLLYHYKSRIPTDTLEKYFYRLGSNVIYSDFGKFTLEYLFKLTDDWVFKQKFSDSTFYKKLKRIKTIYDVSLTNLKGSKTSFSDFKGNIILIDFWSTGCIPCIRNAPYLKKLSTEFKTKHLKIISVSLDEYVDTWKESIKKFDFPGIHLFDANGLLSTFYKVIWVPRYIIINSDGTVVNMDAPQAINPQLKILLDNLLNKKKS